MLPGEMEGHRVLRALARCGWVVVSQRGSHRKLVHGGRPGHVVVAFHGTLHRPTVRKILARAGISEEEFLHQF